MNTPSIAAVSGLQQALVRQEIDVAVLAKANDLAKTQQQAALQLLTESTEAVKPAEVHGHTGHGRELNVIA